MHSFGGDSILKSKHNVKRHLQLQNGDIIEEYSDEHDNVTESNASELNDASKDASNP